jgi:molybdenum cofactor cytidylyltransferase
MINISAIILAAGESKRMGRPKMLLPWGNTTVLGHVIQIYKKAGLEKIIIVTGAEKESIEQLAAENAVTCIHNPEYSKGEMLSSIQIGLRSLDLEAKAALICLGDQPQVEEKVVRDIVQRFENEAAPLIVPSYQMRRGHPWLVGRGFWPFILGLKSPATTRDFLIEHASLITYQIVDTPSVIEDLDTPEEYERHLDRFEKFH